MFSAGFTVLIDACSLASTLKRNVRLSLAEAEFFRPRWSMRILDETERAIAKMLVAKRRITKTGAAEPSKNAPDAKQRAARARHYIATAFEEAMVEGYDAFPPVGRGLPDPDDAHVLAAALQCRADIIVTENLKHFPATFLQRHKIEARNTDQFIAGILKLDPGRGVAALHNMRNRFSRPEITPDELLRLFESNGMVETEDFLKEFLQSL
jgi:hypothetical protein